MLKDPQDRASEYYFHYFIGGIRGLGTWGIGYLLDHESSRLVRLAEHQMEHAGSEDIQLLLEITYENFRITGIRDVSEEDDRFFAKRYSDAYIRKQLERHPEWLPKTR